MPITDCPCSACRITFLLSFCEKRKTQRKTDSWTGSARPAAIARGSMLPHGKPSEGGIECCVVTVFRIRGLSRHTLRQPRTAPHKYWIYSLREFRSLPSVEVLSVYFATREKYSPLSRQTIQSDVAELFFAEVAVDAVALDEVVVFALLDDATVFSVRELPRCCRTV